MKTLRKGDRGKEVGKLQEKLIAAGYRIKLDNSFWDETDKSVRAFQCKKGMLPDGIAGPKTLGALGITDATNITLTASRLLNDLYAAIGAAGLRAATFAKTSIPSFQSSRPASQYHISSKGFEFIYTHETQQDVSNKLHWPGGASGITLGPGYDMRERSPVTITGDMIAIGIDLAAAQKIAKGSGLKNTTVPTAQQFARNNVNVVNLTPEQEKKLLRHIVQGYEKRVKNALKVDLMQHEFDALVSFAYNSGGRFKTVSDNINQGKVAIAMATIRAANKSGGAVLRTLVVRRDDEVALYLFNNYGKLRSA